MVLDPSLTPLVTVALANQAHHGTLDAWVWTYLRACLALSVGYDAARAVVSSVRESETSRLERLQNLTKESDYQISMTRELTL